MRGSKGDPSSLSVPRQPRVLPPIARIQPCRFWAAQAGGSPCPLLGARSAARGEFPASSLSQSQPSPPRQAGVRCRFPEEPPALLPVQPRGLRGAQGRPVGRSCWQRCGGVGELGTAARRERPLRLRACLGEPHTKPRQLRLPGDPCLPGSRHPEPDAGQGEPEVGAQGRARGWTGGRWPGQSKLCSWQSPRGWQGWDSSALPVANSP